jgi:HPt (histidine-containing phosphotransfer) domain-containing protein
LFAEDLPRHLTTIQRALDARDGDALQRAAHLLKGAAANFEAAALVGAARTLEEMGRSAQLDGSEKVWRTLTSEATLLSAVLEIYAAPFPLPSPASGAAPVGGTRPATGPDLQASATKRPDPELA